MTSTDIKLCNDFKQYISLCCHVVVMLVVALKELWTSTAESKWQVSWQGMSCRSIPMIFSSAACFFQLSHGGDICALICIPFYMSTFLYPCRASLSTSESILLRITLTKHNGVSE